MFWIGGRWVTLMALMGLCTIAIAMFQEKSKGTTDQQLQQWTQDTSCANKYSRMSEIIGLKLHSASRCQKSCFKGSRFETRFQLVQVGFSFILILYHQEEKLALRRTTEQSTSLPRHGSALLYGTSNVQVDVAGHPNHCIAKEWRHGYSATRLVSSIVGAGLVTTRSRKIRGMRLLCMFHNMNQGSLEPKETRTFEKNVSR
jgi:hypothetical protein